MIRIIILRPSLLFVFTKVSDEYVIIIFKAEDCVSALHRRLAFSTKTQKLLSGKLYFSFTESKAAPSSISVY